MVKNIYVICLTHKTRHDPYIECPECKRERLKGMVNRPYNFYLIGRAKEVFRMLMILAKTEPIETDPDWWGVRAYVIALDQDQMASGLSMTDRLVMRRN